MRTTKGKFDRLNTLANERGIIAALAIDMRGALKQAIADAKGQPISDAQLTEFKTIVAAPPMPATVSESGSARLRPFHALIPPIATAEQLAASITFLLSDDATNINGAILPSDNGWSIQ